MIDNPVHALTFGDLVWVEDGANPPDSSGVVYRVRAQDATFGTAVPVTVALLWLGRAGGPVSYDSTPNREPVFRVTVEADDSDLLARGEMALQLQCEQATTLTWTPPDGAGEPSVFDIVWSHLEPVFDTDGLTGVGMEETVVRTRTYLVRMQALPYARSADLVVTPAQAPTPTYTPLNDCSSLTGWTNFGGLYTLSIVSGNLRISRTGAFWNPQARLTQAIAASAYIAVDLGNAVNLTAINVGGAVATVDLGGGVTRWFLQGTSAPTTYRNFIINGTVSVPASASSVDILQVQLADAVPFFGTARQKTMSLVPGGSVRTHGSIHVTHATNALGKVIVYTCPSGVGYLPPLRRWRSTSATVTTDSTLVSGARNAIGATSTDYLIPVTALPTGRAELWAIVRAVTATGIDTVTWSVGSWINSVELAVDVRNTAVNFVATNTWYLVPLGAVAVPNVKIGPAGYVRVSLLNAGTNIQVDEAYLFATDQGSLTVVDCSTGTPAAGGPSNHLWIDAPSLDEPMGAIYRGTAADRSDAFHAGQNADTWGTHDFDPTGTSVFVVTPGTTDAQTSLEHYRRYNTFVTREA